MLGDSLLTTPNKIYQSEKKAILDNVAAHDRKPSFNGKQITLAVSDSITLTDTNGRLAAFTQQTANTAIRILDENGKTVVSGRTDKNGAFSFGNLPKCEP